jgi:phytoene/squalene synthetase
MAAEAIARQVERGDPDRWRAAMLAPPTARDGLMALYAFNLEIARAPWLASEPLLAQIRLQWWRDALAGIAAGEPPRRHEVVQPLAAAIRAASLPPVLFEQMVDARLADTEPTPHPDRAALLRYLDATAGNLMELAARHLGASGDALPVVRDFARGAGAAALLRALPGLSARGRQPLPADTTPADLAREGLDALAGARARRARVPAAAAPALLAGWRAGPVLARALGDPRAVAEGRLESSEFSARAGQLLRAISGRW